jgi:hypothetical protein
MKVLLLLISTCLPVHPPPRLSLSPLHIPHLALASVRARLSPLTVVLIFYPGSDG